MFSAAPIVFGVGTIGVLYTMASWWGDVIKEAQYKGDHTRVVHPADRAERHDEGRDRADHRPRARVDEMIVVMLDLRLSHCR
ncbi:cytochrome c oxidase subunit 3, partial [Bradyrhizobium brasilense]|uniref:cytochrome c oxidase subunit 3 n=1 Tax=Bradyrhizobium brasilense TaxID=1419277 RepID=UPI001F20F928